MLRHLANRTSVLVSQLRPDQSLYEKYAGSLVQNAFFVTSIENRRMTDLACGLASGHCVDARLAQHGERNAERIKAIRVANHTFGRVQTPPRDLTPAEYEIVDELMRATAPSYASYQPAMAAYQARVRSLMPVAGAVQPKRTAYHDAQLHYVSPSFVQGEAAKETVRQWCDFGSPDDIPAINEFGTNEIPEVEWQHVWSGYTLELKLRWFEFKARVEEVQIRNRYNTYVPLRGHCSSLQRRKLHSSLV